jgi:hypothetical protein
MHNFLIYFIYLFTSALHVSDFLLAHLQRQSPGYGVSARALTPYPGDLCITLAIRQVRL